MNALASKIAGLIRATGPLPVSDYMALCLFDPEHGYYTTRQPFGRDGDFITAPEISQMFGELIGAWLAAAWRDLGEPRGTILAEIGPGRGTLMKDILRTVAQIAPDLFANSTVHLIEASPRLTKIQQQTLESAGVTPTWHKAMSELPAGPLLIVGNELFDALPTRQYILTEQDWRERCVGLNDQDELVFVAGSGSIDTDLLPPEAASAPPGTVFEASPARSSLMQHIAQDIAEQSGAALFIDYGHLEPGLGDTLQAVLDHKYDDPLANPGRADLTTHVDFAALASAVRAVGLIPHMTTQGDFLVRTGLLERAGRLGSNVGPAIRAQLSEAVERLAGPDKMGNLFKVLAFSSSSKAPAPFA
ncbi:MULTISPECIES: class I SAM-dependent methyltransferase [Mesorhizobium]|uniref:Class I SAM-dependent methyltransferase n=1 Tax=Mesorhizobium denitrificans TaxID=2294114 RepID=A0A371XE63_9HYPH|nr:MULTISPECIES: class I SAM-dependent methyltransferase [Mesorhizobium]RFC67502.1 class I SAM-dependent methyltransferase [Mesorhizobium denitrificans]